MLHPRFKHKKGLMNKRGLLFLYLGFFLIFISYRYIFLPVFFALFVAAAAAVFSPPSFSFLLVLFFSEKGIHHIRIRYLFSELQLSIFFPLLIWKWVV